MMAVIKAALITSVLVCAASSVSAATTCEADRNESSGNI